MTLANLAPSAAWCPCVAVDAGDGVATAVWYSVPNHNVSYLSGCSHARGTLGKYTIMQGGTYNPVGGKLVRQFELMRHFVVIVPLFPL